MDVQPELFTDSTAGPSISRAAPGTASGRSPAALAEAGSAATTMARAPAIVSRLSDDQRLR